MSDDSVDSGTAIIEVIIGEDDQNGILPLLATDKNCIAPEQLKLLHGIVRKCNDGIVIVDCIGNPMPPS